MLQIPLQTEPVQQLRTVLEGQKVQIYMRQKPQGLFVDVESDGVAVATGALALDCVPLIPRDYSGFIGNLIFIDTQGADDPNYSEFGSRFVLAYLTADEYAQL